MSLLQGLLSVFALAVLAGAWVGLAVVMYGRLIYGRVILAGEFNSAELAAVVFFSLALFVYLIRQVRFLS